MKALLFLRPQIPALVLFLFMLSGTGPAAAEPATLRMATASRFDRRVDVFWISADGSVWSSWWEDGQNQNMWSVPLPLAPAGSAAPLGGISAAARTRDDLNVFWIGPDGSVRTAGWSVQSGSWSQPVSIAAPGSAGNRGGLVALSRRPDHLDVFWVTPGGNVMSNWWNQHVNSARWNSPFTLAYEGAADPGSNLAAISRFPEQLDVFWVAANGSVLSNWWSSQANQGRWNSPFPVAGPGSASPGSGITATTRFADHADVYWIAPDGTVMGNWWIRTVNNGYWNMPFPVAPAGSAEPQGGLTSLVRSQTHADLFWVGPDRSVRSTWWDQGLHNAQWTPVFNIAGAGAAVQQGSLAAVSRYPAHMDLFWPGADDLIHSNWWDQYANNGFWNTPFALPEKPSSRFTQGTIATPDAINNTYRGVDGKIRKSVRPAREGETPKTGGPKSDGAPQQTTEGDFVCTTTPVTENNQTFESIVLSNPTDLFYPGAVVDAASIANGSYQLQSPDYAPLRLTIDLLGGTSSGSNTTIIPANGGKIYRGNVYDGIAGLLRNTQGVGNAANSSIDFRQTESEEELEMFLGGSFSGWGANVSARMNMSQQKKRNVIYVKYVQKYFSVIVDSPPQELFPEASYAQQPGWCMVQKVNYGRLAIVRFESNYSAEELGASLKASYGGFGFGASADFSLNTRKVLSETTASAVFIGGDPVAAGKANASLLDKSVDEIINSLKSYIQEGSAINKNVSITPISFELVFLNGARALVQTTTNYVNRECRPLARTLEFTFEGLSIFDNINESFSGGGNDYNMYTGYQNDRNRPLTLEVWYTDKPNSRQAAELVSREVIWDANADQGIRAKSSPSNAFHAAMRTPYDEGAIKGPQPLIAPFGDPGRGGGRFVPRVRINIDPGMLRQNQVLVRLSGQVSRELTFDDDYYYLTPATANEYLVNQVFQKKFTLEYKHNNSENRCFLHFSLMPLY